LRRNIILAAILAIALPACAVEPADRIVVEKADRRITLFAQGVPIRSFKVALGGAPEGPKQQEGDERTPEGLYSINARNPNSAFHRSLQISYPDSRDRARAAAAHVDPGGLIMIHGLPNRWSWLGRLHRLLDWTDGCIAVTDAEMDEIWQLVELGTPIEIKP